MGSDLQVSLDFMHFALVIIIRVRYKLIENLRFGDGLQRCGGSSSSSYCFGP
jgi:hypothetical protein